MGTPARVDLDRTDASEVRPAPQKGLELSEVSLLTVAGAGAVGQELPNVDFRSRLHTFIVGNYGVTRIVRNAQGLWIYGKRVVWISPETPAWGIPA